MNNEQIKQLALESGFKLKEQPDGSMDLNPYIYQFAEKLITASQNNWISLSESMPKIDEWALFLDGNNSMYSSTSNPIHIDKIIKGADCFVHYLHNYTHWQPLPSQKIEND